MKEVSIKVEDLEETFAHYVFRYLGPTAKVKHAIRRNIGSASEALHSNRSAQCGRSPVWFAPPPGWYGTGTQEEYEKNDALPVCKRCWHVITEGSMTHQVQRTK